MNAWPLRFTVRCRMQCKRKKKKYKRTDTKYVFVTTLNERFQKIYTFVRSNRAGEHGKIPNDDVDDDNECITH